MAHGRSFSPSWNDGQARAAILDFVARVAQLWGPDYVRPAERIAVFDNDGTPYSALSALQFGDSPDRIALLTARLVSLRRRE
jgi:hypothetical protein